VCILIYQPFYKTCQLKQIGEPEYCPVGTCNYFRIRIDEFRPRFRHRTDPVFVYLKQQPFPVAIVSLAYASELTPGTGVKWVSY